MKSPGPNREPPSPWVQLEFQALLDAAVDAVFLIDHRGRIELVNSTALRMFGYQEQELLGVNVATLMPEPDRSRHDRYMGRYLETGRERIIGIGREVRALRKDGSIFEAELAVGRIPQVEPPRFVGFIRDITGRKDAEEALRRSEAQLRTAQELASLGNYVINFDGEEADYWSPQLYRILGRDPSSKPIGLDEYCERLVHPADRDRVRQAYVDLDAGARPFDLEYRIVLEDGSQRYLHHITQVVRNVEGRVVKHVGTMHDITERRRAEDELRQSQERLTHFNRLSTMGEMAAGIAHEINQPLTAIATYAQASTRLAKLDTLPREDLLMALEQIAKQALRAGEVIRRLRSFVKNREVRREPVEVNRLLDDLLLLAETDARHHNVRVRIEPAGQNPVVQADPVQIQQVMLNLVRNSIDAMLEVSEDRREILLRARIDPSGDVEIMVQDRGSGFLPGAESELFTPFYTTKAGGTGLGLAISRSIVRAHGGKLWSAENPAGGARFFFTLPLLAGIEDGQGPDNDEGVQET
ncbi:MAG TPA: PAS domain S-box protein [Steroidobacteraceae bacterium]|nr:PAS domain S-box protein [Steroidobacteraceae bacterium]